MTQPVRPSLRLGLAASAAVLALAASPALAAPPDQVKLPDGAQVGDYVGQDLMIPMRDGVKLHAQVWRPKSQSAHNTARYTHSAGNSRTDRRR